MLAPRCLAVVLTVLVSIVTACGSEDKAPTVALDASYSPQPSLEDAVTALLTAEKANNRAESFKVLSPDGRMEYSDVADWTTRRNQLPVVGDFTLEKSTDNTQVVLVTRTPSLDPFKGLSAAQERQTWTGTKFSEGWLLAPEPSIELVLPPDADAGPAVKAWAEAVQACDPAKAATLQAIPNLLANTAPVLCQSTGAVFTGTIGPLPEGLESQLIIEQYSTDSLDWARSVEVTAPVPFHAIVAPLGDNWRVVGLY